MGQAAYVSLYVGVGRSVNVEKLIPDTRPPTPDTHPGNFPGAVLECTCARFFAGYNGVTAIQWRIIYMVMNSEMAPPRTGNGVEKGEHRPDIQGPLPGPEAERLIERDQAVISPSYTR